jgi:hypothetical protein
MSAKAGFPFALVLTVLGIGMAHGDEPTAAASGTNGPVTAAANPAQAAPQQREVLPPPSGGMLPGAMERTAASSNPTGPLPAGDEGQPPPSAASPPGMLSSWIEYVRPECCGPIGGNGPIGMSLYAETGPSFVTEGAIFGHALRTVGWDIQAGGRSLFFNVPQTSAWTIDLSLSDIYNHGSGGHPITLELPNGASPPALEPRDVNLSNMHRTYVNLALGKEWYLNAPAKGCGPMWVAGLDAGGRLGTAKAEFHEIIHRTDTIYGALAGAYLNVEMPCGCCTWLAGLRLEYDWTWMNRLLQDQNANIEDLNLMLTVGVRF